VYIDEAIEQWPAKGRLWHFATGINSVAIGAKRT
jgi:hypothetical protein